ncbi:hypothetical protein XA68_18058 [Ophiocordyceps unilateralis]|uniref:BZIP domain-containing protein n=1 Tax=Ophiocordyceps unilateralis TaxID=268505 RepID=A0A2A9PI47_OPHUN|nr:hypothetical protein XA68_18058 [Ophiocordyceps unilateralis]
MAGAKSGGPTSASAIRIRENQRRSRARRKEYVESMERRIQEYERRGVEATLEMQQAARTVAVENGRLRLMLAHMGAGASDVEAFLQQLRHQDAAHALSTVRLHPDTVVVADEEAVAFDKLQVLASASVQQSGDDEEEEEKEKEEDDDDDDDRTCVAVPPGVESPWTVERSSPGASSSYTRGISSPGTSTLDSPPVDMTCDAAAQIIADMQSGSSRSVIKPLANPCICRAP